MPTNLYGINDKYDEKISHVIPALIKRFLLAKKNMKKTVEVWGSGNPKREFLFADDCASAIYFIMKRDLKIDLVNIGSDKDISIKELAQTIKKIINYNGKILFNRSMPDGVLRKKLDISKLKNLGWKPSVKLQDGIKRVVDEISKTI